MRCFIYLSYDGTPFCGWQVQPNGTSVQGELHRALKLLLRTDVAVTGAGRTDAGVHARLMVAHFDLPDPFRFDHRQGQEALAQLAYRLNGVLPPEIAIDHIERVPDDAHARFSAKSRTYHYYIHTAKSPFLRNYSWRLAHQPDIHAMNEAAAVLAHYTDFTSFSKVNTDTKTNICHINHARWEQLGPHQWRFEIQADRFLRNMVRAIVGTLMMVGRHDIDLQGFRRIIEARNRSAAGDSVPARGLYLVNICY